MPVLVRCEDLQPGMRLSEAFLYRGRVMLAASTELSLTEIESLRNRFPKHSVRIQDPLLDGAVEFEDDSQDREVARKAQRIISDCMWEVRERFNSQSSLDALSIHSIYNAVQEVIEFLRSNPVSLALVDNYLGSGHYLNEHAGNVFYLSMLLAAANREYVSEERQRQTDAPNLSAHVTANLGPLGIGAMLIDLGMMPLSHLYTDDQPLTPDVWQQIREHPLVGAAMLKEEFWPVTRAVVRTHHERLDGSGYPNALAGDDLHVFSRIVRIADAYDAATSNQVYKDAKTPARVLWEMTVGPYRRFYDQTLMESFCKMIQPFPIGAKIRLKDRRYGVVVKYNREDPTAPYVVIAFDSINRRIPDSHLEGVFKLGELPEIRAASFRGEDLSFIYEPYQDETTGSRVGVWPSLFEAAYP
jgi:HD-GYP domain-containing protein (c-di-GMP phosphodiesterase class II)